jgi:hypothetical protein
MAAVFFTALGLFQLFAPPLAIVTDQKHGAPLRAISEPARNEQPLRTAVPPISAGPGEAMTPPAQGNLSLAVAVVPAKEAAAHTPAQAAAVKKAADLKVPESLGRLKISAGVTVMQLLRDIYGRTGTDRFNAVIAANPHIDDINRVRVGEMVSFPAVPAAAPWPEHGQMVRIAYEDKLDDAYRLFKKHNSAKKNTSPVRIMPFWNPREGMVFALVLRQVFYSEEEARRAIGNQPPALAATAAIMEKPGADTIFFAN